MTAITAWLDSLLGRVTMYRLVVLCLAAITVVSLVLGATGVIFYSPLAMLASLAVLLVVSVGASQLLGIAFSTRPHAESAIITAMLLFFILPPTLDPGALLVLALAAALASASKFLLVVRGRHIVNPAAFGALLVGIVGLIYSVWWVATPQLLPFVVIAGFLVLYRTRRLQLGATFIVIAGAASTVRYLTSGGSLSEALSITFLSLPVVFFACFMLSEPLTLPPRRWQQYAYAAIVGIIYAVPFSLTGPTFGLIAIGLFASPEFALGIGNVLAFLVGQRRGIRLSYAGRRQLTPTSWEFEFTPDAPVRFTPGQYLELSVPHRGVDGRGWRRTFSIASAPGARTPEDPAPVRLGLRIPDARTSSFKRALLDLEPGTRLAATAVGGDFLLPTDHSRPVLLVAGGIGVTPFVAQLEHATAMGEKRDVVLVYSVSSTDEIAYAVELARSGARVLLVAPEPLNRMPEHWEWLGAGPLTAELLLGAVPDATSRWSYVSGPPRLIAALKPALRRAGVKHLRTDAFIGY